ncbi:MAG: TetR/AcrR family transcriptional regulator [Casimicrobium sp.]|jgi:TetR/AcrR family transcriptional repressor of nem operon
MLATEHTSKTKLLDAALKVIRSKGYTAATLDDICAAAGVTKGSYFHHFKSKEEMALMAIEHWNTMTGGLFAHAPYTLIADPRDRVLAYIDFRAEILQGELPDYTCLLGTMVQEVYETHPRITVACKNGIAVHAAVVAKDIAAAKAMYAPDATWQPEDLAFYTQATIQGAFILAKAQGSVGGVDIATACIAHLRRYVASLLNPPSDSKLAQEITP